MTNKAKYYVGQTFIAFHTNGWLLFTITNIIDKYWVNTTKGVYSKSQISKHFIKHKND